MLSPRRSVTRARTAFGNVSTLKSDRQGSGEIPVPTLYDAALDDDWSEPTKARKPRAPRPLPPPGSVDPGLIEQSELELGPGARRGQWVLPPAQYLTRSTQQTVNKAEVEARGRTLVDALTLPRRRDQVVRPDRRPHRHEIRARAGLRGQGRQGHQPQPRHRLRNGCHRRADPGPDPGPHGHRRRGAEPHPPAGQPGRHHVVARGQGGNPSARRGHRQGHRRSIGVPQPLDDPAPADRRHHRRRQVERPQLHPHFDPDAQHTRPGSPHPDRPEAGRDGPVQPFAAPAHATGDQPEEGGQCPRLGGEGDGAALRPAVRGRVPRHHRLQRGVRPRRAASAPAAELGSIRSPGRTRIDSSSDCRTS